MKSKENIPKYLPFYLLDFILPPPGKRLGSEEVETDVEHLLSGEQGTQSKQHDLVSTVIVGFVQGFSQSYWYHPGCLGFWKCEITPQFSPYKTKIANRYTTKRKIAVKNLLIFVT